MSCGKPYKHILQNSVHPIRNIFRVPYSKSRKLTDDQMECLEFGICSFVPKLSEEIPYFHF